MTVLWFLAQTNDLVRPVVSLDFDDIVSLLVAIAAILTAVGIKRSVTKSKSESKAETHAVSEVVDDSVLAQFKELYEKITALELSLDRTNKTLAETQDQLKEALRELGELRKLEEYLQARLHEKDTEILKLRDEKSNNEREIKGLTLALSRAEARIDHLELVCRNAGINGDPE